MIPQIAMKILKRNRQHTLRAIYGVSVSIAIVISLLAFFTGFSIQISQIVNLAGNSQSILISSSTNELISSSLLDNASQSNILSIIPIQEQNILFNSTVSIYVKQINLNLTLYLQNHPESYIQSGRLPLNSSEFIASSNLVSTLNLSLNQPYSFDSQSKVLVGTVADNLELLNAIVFNVLPVNCTFISVILSNPNYGSTTLSYLQNYVGSQYIVSYAKESISYLTTIFSEIISKFSLILIVIIFISFIRIYFFVMWIIIHNIRDFLILRIVGYTNVQMLCLVLYFAFIIGNLGLFVGIVLGLSLPLILSNVVPLITHLQYIPYIPDLNTVFIIIFLVNVSIVLGAVRPYFELARMQLSLATNG